MRGAPAERGLATASSRCVQWLAVSNARCDWRLVVRNLQVAYGGPHRPGASITPGVSSRFGRCPPATRATVSQPGQYSAGLESYSMIRLFNHYFHAWTLRRIFFDFVLSLLALAGVGLL